jgi:hypothetical protein
MADLFADIDLNQPAKTQEVSGTTVNILHAEGKQESEIRKPDPEKSQPAHSQAVKIVWFYDNNSFEEFYPRKQ